MWIPYAKAIAKNMTGYPRVGDSVLYRARGGKNPIWYKATITRVIDYRRYIVKYEVPENVRSSFLNGTSSAIVRIDHLSFFYDTVNTDTENEGLVEE